MSSPPEEQQVRAELAGWLQQAGALRKLIRDGFPASDAPPLRFYEHLLATRQAQDRVEELLSMALGYRAAAMRHHADVQAAYEDDWDATWDRARRQGRRDEYMSGRERQAETDLAVLARKRAARAAKNWSDVCTDVESRIRLVHRGLDSTRQDLTAALRHLGWEAHLERT